MVDLASKRTGDLLALAIGLTLLVFMNMVGSRFAFRVDLTEEKKYSISAPTRELLAGLDDDVYAEVYLAGDLNAPFQRFQKTLRETLDEFRVYSRGKFHFTFTDPLAALSQKARAEFLTALAQKGISATNIVETKQGETSEKIVVPGLLLSYRGVDAGVTLFRGSSGGGADESINQAVENIEYQVARAIYKLTNVDRKRIAWIVGHEELDSLQCAGFNNALLEVYDVYKVDLTRRRSLRDYDMAIVAGPRSLFSPAEAYKLDQYIMGGGKVLFLLDRLDASMDSVMQGDYYAFPLENGLNDMLFHYGIRVNQDLIQDRNAALYPIVTGSAGGRPQIHMLPWPFYPLVNHYADHVITRNLDAVALRFASTIDSVKADGVRKTPLMFSSEHSRAVGAPVRINVNDLRETLGSREFGGGPYTLAYLLEGTFTSCFVNRFLPDETDKQAFRSRGTSTLIAMADGDIARNELNPRTGNPLPLGYDPYVQYTFANEDLLLNAVAYLAGDDGLITARNKEVMIRPLDRVSVRAEKHKWQVINLGLPVVLIVILGVIHHISRMRKYGRF